ncbi:AEC family transporter [Archangium primigenium]|uniref:AEC family transporter n=1 Tax=[Archangium] primigenium TaxID=2792470 RepID=UPI001957BC82|nr:AEC family transporter [Archangium primigenium]MBM7119241.1 AEC family transporter [Archangium primigenium]
MTSIVALLVACLLLGLLARRSGRFPEQTAPVLNTYVLYVALPALVLRSIHRLSLVPELLLAALTPWLVFGAAWLLLRGVGPRLGLAPASVAALVLSGGLGNTAFVGLPFIEGARGPEGVTVAVVVDQLGSFLVLSTLASLFAARAAARDTRPGALVRKLLTFPPLLALGAGFLSQAWAWPGWMDDVLARLGGSLTPLALFSVGYQLRLSGLAGRGRALVLGLGYKLVLAPLLIALVLLAVPRLDRLVFEVSVLQAAMGPMVTGALLAVEHDLDPDLAVLMVGVGIPLSFLTLAGVLWALGPGGLV